MCGSHVGTRAARLPSARCCRARDAAERATLPSARCFDAPKHAAPLHRRDASANPRDEGVMRCDHPADHSPEMDHWGLRARRQTRANGEEAGDEPVGSECHVAASAAWQRMLGDESQWQGLDLRFGCKRADNGKPRCMRGGAMRMHRAIRLPMHGGHACACGHARRACTAGMHARACTRGAARIEREGARECRGVEWR